MHKTFAKGLFYAVAVILVLWTSSLTYSFVASVLPNSHWAMPLFALVVFDIGMIAWLKVYLDAAQGTGQRAVALGACIFDFIGVGLMALAELFLGGQTLVSAPERLGEFALWGIGVWTVANVGAVLAFHLLDPNARKSMALRTEMDAIFDESLAKLKTKRVSIGGKLSDQLADGMLMQLVAELSADVEQEGVPDELQERTAVPAGIHSANGQVEADFLSDTSQ